MRTVAWLSYQAAGNQKKVEKEKRLKDAKKKKKRVERDVRFAVVIGIRCACFFLGLVFVNRLGQLRRIPRVYTKRHPYLSFYFVTILSGTAVIH